MENAINRDQSLGVTALEAIESSLISLRSRGPSRADMGICANLDDELEQLGFGCYEECAFSWREGAFEIWPKFSGMLGWPVPSAESVPSADPMKTYYSASDAGSLWDETTEYGRLRYELLDFLIEQIKKDILHVRSR